MTLVSFANSGFHQTEQVTLDTLAYAARLMGEIADDVVNMDRAMRWGFAWEMGPFQTWDAYGVEKGIKRMKELTERPAMAGGEPIRGEFLPFALPLIGREEEEEVLDSLRSGWMTTGPKVQRFEKQYQLVNLDVELVTLANQKAALQTKLDDSQVQVSGARARRKALTDEIKREGQDLEASEMSLHEYKRDKNILSVSMDDQSNMLRAQMNQLNGVLTGG